MRNSSRYEPQNELNGNEKNEVVSANGYDLEML